MYNQYFYGLGSAKSCIRELFEYGLQQAAVVGKENVFDFSLATQYSFSCICKRSCY